MTCISNVATVATEVGILGIGLEAQRHRSVKNENKQELQACEIHNSLVLATYREVKRDITNITGCMCVGSICCSVSERRRSRQFRGVNALHLLLI